MVSGEFMVAIFTTIL